jgi:hypothetical protein
LKPPPPPPPAAGYPKHYQIALTVVPTLLGVYQDFQLPPGKILSVQWVAVNPAQTNVSNGVEVTFFSPSMYFRFSPSGTSEMFIGPGGGNVRVIARRKNLAGAFQATVSFELGQP